MKKSKYLLTFIAVLFSSGFLLAQEYKVTVQNTREGKLILNDFQGQLPIEGYSGNEIIITSTSENNHTPPERAKGLKPVYAGGTDNTGLGLSVEKNGNQVTVHSLYPITKSNSFKIKIPDNFAIKLTSGCERSNSVDIQNMKNEIEINTCHSIKLKNVTGPLVLSTISGSIEATFTELSKDKPISIASVSGELDITLPAKTPVDLEISTINGNVYSDFDFPNDNKEMKKIGGSTINAKLNGGGVDFKMNTISGNIYLRKG